MLPRGGRIAILIAVLVAFEIQTSLSQINRASFPKGFVFGTASSAFQYEGAVKADGRGPSVWDAFSHTFGNPSFPAKSTLIASQPNSKTSSEDGVISQVLVSKSLIFSFRELIKAKQRGFLGISLDVIWFEPATNTTNDIEAAQRAQDFQLGWFIEPLILGNYPITMRNRVGDRLPNFTENDVALVKGSFDFVGINHYTTFYARSSDSLFGDLIGKVLNDSLADSGAITLPFGEHLKPIGDRASSIWLYIVPQGMRSLMNYIRQKYGNPPVIITENGMDDPNHALTPIKDALKDEKRIKYHKDYLTSLLASINFLDDAIATVISGLLCHAYNLEVLVESCTSVTVMVIVMLQ
ncbi:hypothetical protein POTOM_036377 [Populus tomentosa]|uniref:Uncharacterized protein n=1 Tax=Populus tomentosa TaxID=118781 RepID=A0A8X7YW02_POPTO|nr:hypothetical protein POTOM_036377 [Populus tomentosa]